MTSRFIRAMLPPSNSEIAQVAHKALVDRGYQPFRNCWPTFLVLRERDKKPVAVHVLRKNHYSIPPLQRLALEALCRAGIECWQFSPEGFHRLYINRWDQLDSSWRKSGPAVIPPIERDTLEDALQREKKGREEISPPQETA